MVVICSSLGIILHLAWRACLFFIMDEPSVPVHSVPVSDILTLPAAVHVSSPVPETTCPAETSQSAFVTVQDPDSEIPQRAQCIVKRFQKRSATQPSPSVEPPISSPGSDALQPTVDTFNSGTDAVCIQPASLLGSLQPPSPSYEADFELVTSLARSEEPFSTGDASGDGSWHLLSGASWPQQPFDTCDSDTELSPWRAGRLHFDSSPAPGALPLASATSQGEPAGTLSSMRESPAVGDTPTSSGKPLARPSSMLACTHRAKSLHSHPVRTLQNARLRPVVHLKASVGNPVACPKPRPVPSARGAYASYPSLTTSWGKQAEGAVSKSSPPVKAQDGMDTSFPLQPAARISGLLPARRSGPLPSFQRPARVRATR